MADTKYHHLHGGSADILPSVWHESMSGLFTDRKKLCWRDSNGFRMVFLVDCLLKFGVLKFDCESQPNPSSLMAFICFDKKKTKKTWEQSKKDTKIRKSILVRGTVQKYLLRLETDRWIFLPAFSSSAAQLTSASVLVGWRHISFGLLSRCRAPRTHLTFPSSFPLLPFQCSRRQGSTCSHICGADSLCVCVCVWV